MPRHGYAPLRRRRSRRRPTPRWDPPWDVGTRASSSDGLPSMRPPALSRPQSCPDQPPNPAPTGSSTVMSSHSRDVEWASVPVADGRALVRSGQRESAFRTRRRGWRAVPALPTPFTRDDAVDLDRPDGAAIRARTETAPWHGASPGGHRRPSRSLSRPTRRRRLGPVASDCGTARPGRLAPSLP